MIKGLIEYKDSTIPFVVDDFKMDLFSELDLVSDFINEYRDCKNYVLKGQCYIFGNQPTNVTFLVERTMGSTCYLKCYIVNRLECEDKYDSIRFESKVLDSIFRYKYHYVDLAREGVNLSAKEIEVYKIPFVARSDKYTLNYLIGHNNRMGLLDSFKMRGKTVINLMTSEIDECFRITLLLIKFSQFLTSHSDVKFERVSLYDKDHPVAEFYCKKLSETTTIDRDIMFYKFAVMKFSSRILTNLAFDLDSKITKSIPLGHITEYDNVFKPKRFIDEITSFEYLFDKLEPNKARNSKYILQSEIKFMFDTFPEILDGTNITSNEIAKQIKKLRIDIVHGYAYYYEFNDDVRIPFYIMKFAELLQRMSLKLIGFNSVEIKEFAKTIRTY